jgi:hypothetical protein
MGYFDGLGEINEQIQELEKKRAEIINRNNKITEEDIIKLDWTRNCFAILHISPYQAMGIPTYEISVAGRAIPQTHGRYIVVLGEDKDYQNNVCYRSDLEGGKFTTSSVKALEQFLEQVQFAKLEYPEKMLAALQAAKKAHERYKHHA